MNAPIDVSDLTAETADAMARFAGWESRERLGFVAGYLGGELEAVAEGRATESTIRRALGYMKAHKALLDQELAVYRAGAARTAQCASTLDATADHTHRCVLYVDAGPHTDTNHLCECGKQWGGA